MNIFNYKKAKELIKDFSGKNAVPKVASLIGISGASLHSYLTDIDSKRKEPPLSVLYELSKILEIKLWDLLIIPYENYSVDNHDALKANENVVIYKNSIDEKNYLKLLLKEKEEKIDLLKDHIETLREKSRENNNRAKNDPKSKLA